MAGQQLVNIFKIFVSTRSRSFCKLCAFVAAAGGDLIAALIVVEARSL